WGAFKDNLERVAPSVEARALVGSWTATSASIRFAKASEKSKLRGLTEWQPGFAEVENPIPWQEVEGKMAEHYELPEVQKAIEGAAEFANALREELSA
ncbi:MAG: hypothetical protein J6T92_06535, partial [Ottowia sp.]|nr:hypothetical protein [Ottowia sp.]